jgi:hypothetical protein
VEEVKALGGDVVLIDGPDLAKRVTAETGNAPITLAQGNGFYESARKRAH